MTARHLGVTLALTCVCVWTAAAVGRLDETMAAAQLAQKWGVRTYRVTEITRETALTRVQSELLGTGGERLGAYTRVRRFRLQDAPEIGGTKKFLNAEEVRLAWAGDVLEVTTHHDTGLFDVTFNGRNLGSVSPLDSGVRHDPELDTLLTTKGYLLELAVAVSTDIDRAVPAARDQQ
jgi:hypothetical protein